MKEIVACVDYSKVTLEVVETAARLAGALQVKLYLLHVVVIHVPSTELGWTEVAPSTIADRMNQAAKEIERLCEPLVRRGLSVSPIVVQGHGSVAHSILAESNRLEPTMVVMGSHGRGALSHLLMGSTVEGVIRKCKCPVLIIPSGVVTERLASKACAFASRPIAPGRGDLPKPSLR